MAIGTEGGTARHVATKSEEQIEPSNRIPLAELVPPQCCFIVLAVDHVWQFFLRPPENFSQGTYRLISMLLSESGLA